MTYNQNMLTELRDKTKGGKTAAQIAKATPYSLKTIYLYLNELIRQELIIKIGNAFFFQARCTKCGTNLQGNEDSLCQNE